MKKKVGTIIGVNITKISWFYNYKNSSNYRGLASGGITYITFPNQWEQDFTDTFEKILNGEFEVEFDIEDELKPEFKDSLNDSEIIDAEFSEIKRINVYLEL